MWKEQLDCIIYNSQQCKIKHLDITKCGKSIYISTEGIISLIDFDIAVIDNNYKSEKISCFGRTVWVRVRCGTCLL